MIISELFSMSTRTCGNVLYIRDPNPSPDSVLSSKRQSSSKRPFTTPHEPPVTGLLLEPGSHFKIKTPSCLSHTSNTNLIMEIRRPSGKQHFRSRFLARQHICVKRLPTGPLLSNRISFCLQFCPFSLHGRSLPPICHRFRNYMGEIVHIAPFNQAVPVWYIPWGL